MKRVYLAVLCDNRHGNILNTGGFFSSVENAARLLEVLYSQTICSNYQLLTVGMDDECK